jgi:CheY-like chemotaxis protein
MNQIRKDLSILIADDDCEDLEMIQFALKESRVLNRVDCVEDGEQLMDFLKHRGRFSDHHKFPTPGLIFLDLNMPKKNGQEALEEIKADLSLRQIPVIILTTSQAEEDIARTYNAGANSFITKPASFESFAKVMKALGRYWFEIVDLPRCDHANTGTKELYKRSPSSCLGEFSSHRTYLFD